MNEPTMLNLELVKMPDGRWMTFVPFRYEVDYVGNQPVLIQRDGIGVPAEAKSPSPSGEKS